MVSFAFCQMNNHFDALRHSTQKKTALNSARKMPLFAPQFAFLNFFSPRYLETSAFTPTPVPLPTAIIKFCIGNARDNAVSASSPSFATNILSTMLYMACTSMDTIIGNDMLMIRRFTGITPILFSCCKFFVVSLIFSPVAIKYIILSTSAIAGSIFMVSGCG